MPLAPPPPSDASPPADGAAPERKRRPSEQGQATRTLILDATERVLVEEGHAAVTTRHVAKVAGVKAPLLHYHFKTTDDLLIAVYRRSAERSVQRQAQAMARNDVIAALWDVNIDPERTPIALEFMAMAQHHKAFQQEMARYANEIRSLQIAALERFFAARGRTPPLPPAALSVIVAGIARAMVMEKGVGIDMGHAETRAALEDHLFSLGDPAVPATAAPILT